MVRHQTSLTQLYQQQHGQAALKLVEVPLGSPERRVFEALAGCFWPGGLTLVAPMGDPRLPHCLSAGTGKVRGPTVGE